MAKKNNTATVMAPSIVMAFTIRFGVTVPDLNLALSHTCADLRQDFLSTGLRFRNNSVNYLLVVALSECYEKIFMPAVLLNCKEVLLLD